jgi:hypothetical protein
MELPGNEKKIQTLFRELKLADERVAPEFKRVWNRAQAPSPGLSRMVKISLAVATALFVITASSLVLWSQTWGGSQPPNPAVAAGPAAIGSMPVPPPSTTPLIRPAVAALPNRSKFNRQDRKLLARRQTELAFRSAAIREALAISSWQSPTVTLLQSPADNVLTSLPQLDRSLNELKTFLPNTPSYQNWER